MKFSCEWQQAEMWSWIVDQHSRLKVSSTVTRLQNKDKLMDWTKICREESLETDWAASWMCRFPVFTHNIWVFYVFLALELLLWADPLLVVDLFMSLCVSGFTWCHNVLKNFKYQLGFDGVPAVSLEREVGQPSVSRHLVVPSVKYINMQKHWTPNCSQHVLNFANNFTPFQSLK